MRLQLAVEGEGHEVPERGHLVGAGGRGQPDQDPRVLGQKLRRLKEIVFNVVFFQVRIS